MATCQAWPVEWPCDITGKTPVQLDAASGFASFLLWGLSGRRLGVCTYDEAYWPATTGACGVVPYMTRAGTWRNGYVGADCCRILLHRRPVMSVEVVEVDGVVLDADEYDIVRGAWLRRSHECWPAAYGCDDPPIHVVYTAGVTPPPGTEMVVGEVACELLKGWAGEPCKLPSRAVSVSRQGVTVQLADPQQYVDNGMLGLPLADAWIRATNPNKLVMPSRVYSPDHARSTPIATTSAPPSSSDQVAFSWRESDPVNKVVVARDGVAHGWLGTYQAQIRSGPTSTDPLVGEFDVAAVAEGDDVRLTFTLDAAASAAIDAGFYYWDAQQVAGPTRLVGTARVTAEITVLA